MKNKINWLQQWQLHAHNFKNGFCHIHCGKKSIKLLPGAGFGDYSHETTQLVAEMMKPYIENETVLDLGSGSGVLSLIALASGAKWVTGIDIDPEAIEHARENSRLNGFEKKCHFSLEKPKERHTVLLLNMIRSEQQVALMGIDLAQFSHIFSSGVLTTEVDVYLKEMPLTLVEKKEKNGWSAFHFKNVPELC